MRKAYTFEGAPKKLGPYSHAVSMNGFVFVSGQGPIVPETNQVIEGGITAQVRQTLENLKYILEQAGTGLHNVVKVNAYLLHMSDFAAFNAVYADYFTADQPVRTTIAADLPLGVLVEIDCIAGLDQPG